MTSPTDDPIRRRRAEVARWTRVASRVGWSLLGLSVVVFFVALLTGFGAVLAVLASAALVGGCVLLAPSIVVGYGVKAAEREDRERGL